MSKPMVFGIGLSKTGTHTLNAALEMLGYRSVHFPSPALMVERRFDEALGGYDAATDITVSAFYRDLDGLYPGSRFILTLRDVDEWLVSVEDHRRRREHELAEPENPKHRIREIVYGTRLFDRDTFARAWRAHVEGVRAYFADRAEDLLEIDVCAGEGWERLCPFLGRERPGGVMPWRNRTAA